MVIPLPAYYKNTGVHSQITFFGRLDGSGSAGTPAVPGFFDTFFDVYFG